MELTDILDPYMFDSHKAIVDALFQVYHDLGDQYIQSKFTPNRELLQRAQEKIRQKYGLDNQEIAKEANEMAKSFQK
jgi:hypothetical protein